jgi:hypothetical protein
LPEIDLDKDFTIQVNEMWDSSGKDSLVLYGDSKTQAFFALELSRECDNYESCEALHTDDYQELS